MFERGFLEVFFINYYSYVVFRKRGKRIFKREKREKFINMIMKVRIVKRKYFTFRWNKKGDRWNLKRVL